MTRDMHLLVCLAEECAEISELCSKVAVRVSKAIRFGLEEVQPRQDRTNAGRIALELADLLAVAELLVEADVISREDVERKKLKVAAFMHYAAKCGTMITPPPPEAPA